MHVKGLDQFRCVQQHLDTPRSLESHRSYLAEPTHGLLSLEDYLRTIPPPLSLVDKIKLWDSALNILVLCDFGLSTPLSRHEDMKPENILIHKPETETPYDWKFKVGDLGLSHFQSIKSCSLEEGRNLTIHCV
jgi:serine/threonine protein kinase